MTETNSIVKKGRLNFLDVDCFINYSFDVGDTIVFIGADGEVLFFNQKKHAELMQLLKEDEFEFAYYIDSNEEEMIIKLIDRQVKLELA